MPGQGPADGYTQRDIRRKAQAAGSPLMRRWGLPGVPLAGSPWLIQVGCTPAGGGIARALRGTSNLEKNPISTPTP